MIRFSDSRRIPRNFYDRFPQRARDGSKMATSQSVAPKLCSEYTMLPISRQIRLLFGYDLFDEARIRPVRTIPVKH